MSKNLILCADGTGNRGGETPDTNVYRTCHAVDLHQKSGRKQQQITFYDNGVGTSSNKYIRAITGALGFGFGHNVRQLYEFLAKHYDDQDIIYLFGFSRGAATVRAFAGMVENCGLVDRNHPRCQTNGRFDHDKFVALINDAFKHYKHKTGGEFKSQEYVISEVRIKFMGIWDTVSALGFPYHRVNDSLLEDLLERPLLVWLLLAIDKTLDFGWLAHSFYNYTPNDTVDHVYHAIAVDDARKTFLPRVWDETGGSGNVSQVWFPGMHSDVGGSYNQTGLAYVTMAWMMERAEHHGLDFVEGALQDANSKANISGKLHNSRDGAAIYYRYAPRDIADLCSKNEKHRPSKLLGPVKIHRSVIDRMGRGIDQYAPGLLPTHFLIVDTPVSNKNVDHPVAYGIDTPSQVDPQVVDANPEQVAQKKNTSQWEESRNQVAAVIRNRRLLYRVFADLTFAIIGTALWLWFYGAESTAKLTRFFGDSKFWTLGADSIPITINNIPFIGELKFDGDVLEYLTPAMFDNFIQEILVNRPTVSVLILVAFIIFYILRNQLSMTTEKRSEAVRDIIKNESARSFPESSDGKQTETSDKSPDQS